MIKYRWLLPLLVMAMMSAAAFAATPLQTVESQVNQLISVLGDKSLTGSEGEEKKKDVIRQLSNTLFDFTVMSRFTLGRYWKDLEPEQKEEFVVLYRKLLEKVYMDRLLEYQDEKVVFESEKSLSESRAEVQTHIVASSGKIPIHYRMVLADGNWKVYDLIIENISLVKNYRGQFNSILSKNTPAEMLEVLREKTSGGN